MSSGAAHESANLLIVGTTGLVGIGLSLITANPVPLAVCLGALQGTLVTPDIDHHVKTREEKRVFRYNYWLGWLWYWYWKPYQLHRKHRGISHTWPRGTTERFLYLNWWLIPLTLCFGILSGYWFWGIVIWCFMFIGWSLCDLMHLGMDGIWSRPGTWRIW